MGRGRGKFPLAKSSIIKEEDSKLIVFVFCMCIDCFNSLEPLKIPNVVCMWAELNKQAS